eukprot:CAMPEP_0170618790 /NCGR_PEP_ID=MMETSP0224-20130122/27151_1 /TAXON_ID=285029 /ORGANISM="Togula jolla, Strain CCCM 725" /LENGTH=165 /DNA_ID=CAMNT_0010944797 /DNA_START=45 /DNA_END=542 /DNA_ORIENTATION=-
MSAMVTLHTAARDGRIDQMNQFLDASDDIDLNALDENGWAPLHHCAANGEAAAAGLLIECDADVNQVDPHGNTPLHIAAVHSKRLVVSALMWGGADISLRNAKGNTVLHEAALSNAKDVAYLIIENGRMDVTGEQNAEGLVPLEVARASGSKEVELTLETGEHVD